MKIATHLIRLVLVAALIGCVLFVAAAAITGRQTAKEDEEEIKKLIVMITCQFPDGETETGAGIIFSVENDRLYIATAAHVVFKEAQPARDVQVQFRWLGRTVKASLLKHAGHPLDLAVLSVTGLKGLGPSVNTLPFDRLGDPSFMQRGDNVYSMGNPGQEKWSVNVTPDKISEIENDSLLYESNFINPGHSGGALLNERWEVVGMIVRDVQPRGEAVKITRIMGKLKEWGFPVNLRAPSPYVTAGNSYTCRVPPDGIVHCWSDELYPADSHGPRFKSVSIGVGHTCVIAFSGDAYCAGEGEKGQLGNGSKTNHNRMTLVHGKHIFSSISAGGWHTCGVTSDGRAYCWGSGVYGRLGNDSSEESLVPVPVSGNLTFKSVSAGFWHTCGVTTTGEAYCWGPIGILSEGGRDFRSETHYSENFAFVPTAVPGGLTFNSISAGYFFTCGVMTNGAAYCWGANDGGRLGDGSLKDSKVPVPVAGRLTFKSVSVGLHACGVTTTGAAYCWGRNAFGQLGNGSKKDSSVPVAVSDNLTFTSISAGRFHTCGVVVSANLLHGFDHVILQNAQRGCPAGLAGAVGIMRTACRVASSTRRGAAPA